MTPVQQILLGAGGVVGTGDWGGLSTGDTYQNGKVYKPNATTFQVWYYPQSRKGSAVTYSMSNLTGGSFQVRQQSNMKIYLVGGGGGGTGENASGGSGGGAITVNTFIPANNETFNFQVGKGGRGGWSQQASQFTGMPSGNPAAGEPGETTSLTGTGLSLSAGGGPVDVTVNATSYSSGSQATISVGNTRGLSITSGSGGRGGSRNLVGEAGANGNAGGGGANDTMVMDNQMMVVVMVQEILVVEEVVEMDILLLGMLEVVLVVMVEPMHFLVDMVELQEKIILDKMAHVLLTIQRIILTFMLVVDVLIKQQIGQV